MWADYTLSAVLRPNVSFVFNVPIQHICLFFQFFFCFCLSYQLMHLTPDLESSCDPYSKNVYIGVPAYKTMACQTF